jgi:hypothetical protein
LQRCRYLDFVAPPNPSGTSRARGVQSLLQRAVLRWLEQQDSPTGSAPNVVTRISRFKADVAAFWSRPIRNPNDEGPTQILNPVRTAIVQCHAEREECWPDCIRSAEILPQLKQLKAELAETEASIRQNEPELRDTNTLFEEYAEWRYEDSSDARYHKLRYAIEKMEHGLYHGTKFERIRSAQLADHLYLAVPAGLVEPEELADGWGLLWIEDNLDISIVHAPEERDCLPANRMHLIQNVAAAAKDHSLRCNGIRVSGGDVTFVRPVRRIRSADHPRLSEQS